LLRESVLLREIYDERPTTSTTLFRATKIGPKSHERSGVGSLPQLDALRHDTEHEIPNVMLTLERMSKLGL
jgi:hypothetical protein